MRKTIFILGLVAVASLAVGNEASAQIRFGGGRGGGISIGAGRGGFYSPYGYSPYYGRNNFYGGGYYGGGYYPYRSGYYAPAYGYSSPSYYSAPAYYAAPAYVYPDTVVQASGFGARESYFSGPTQNSATLTVYVPRTDAEVWFDGAPTTQRGIERHYHTSALTQGGTYSIRARWTENGKAMEQERHVRVQPGQSATVDFRVEMLPIPK